MAAPLPLPALHATHAGIWLCGADGNVREAQRGEAIARAAETPHIILNAPLIGQRLGYADVSGLDLLQPHEAANQQAGASQQHERDPLRSPRVGEVVEVR